MKIIKLSKIFKNNLKIYKKYIFNIKLHFNSSIGHIPKRPHHPQRDYINGRIGVLH